MLICVTTVEVCDATDDDSSNAAGNIIIFICYETKIAPQCGAIKYYNLLILFRTGLLF